MPAPPHPDFARIDAAMIDLDGTLVDTMPDFSVAIGRMLGELGLPTVDDDFIRRSIGKGADVLVRAVLETAAAPKSVDADGWLDSLARLVPAEPSLP